MLAGLSRILLLTLALATLVSCSTERQPPATGPDTSTVSGACNLPAPAAPQDISRSKAVVARGLGRVDQFYDGVRARMYGVPFEELADQQIFLSIVPDAAAPGDAGRLEVIPGNQLSAGWLQRYGPAVTRAVRNLVQIVRAEGYPVRLNGIALATSTEGLLASLTATTMSHSPTAGALGHEGRMLLVASMEAIPVLEPGLAGAYLPQSGWIILAPELRVALTSILDGSTPVDPAEARPLAYILRHELEHAVTPQSTTSVLLAGRRGGPSEEGTASVLARWPGAVNGVLDALGAGAAAIPPDASYDDVAPEPDGYTDEVAWVRALLKLAGVGTGPDDIADARELLQAHPMQLLPISIAERLVEDGAIPAARCSDLADAIGTATPTAAAVRKAAREVLDADQ